MSSASSSRVNLSLTGHRMEFLGGGVLEIQFRERRRKLYHSLEDQTMMILQDRVVGSPRLYLFHVPAQELKSPRLVKQCLLQGAAFHHHIVVIRALDCLSQLVASQAIKLLKNGPNPHSAGLRLFADVEVVEQDVVYHLEEERTPSRRGAPKSALRKLERGEGVEADGTCVVCLNDLSSSEITRTPCNHMFHGFCLLQWLKSADTCPICRRQLPDD